MEENILHHLASPKYRNSHYGGYMRWCKISSVHREGICTGTCLARVQTRQCCTQKQSPMQARFGRPAYSPFPCHPAHSVLASLSHTPGVSRNYEPVAFQFLNGLDMWNMHRLRDKVGRGALLITLLPRLLPPQRLTTNDNNNNLCK